MGKWSELPKDLLDLIGQLLSYVDYIRFRAVCVQWKSVLPSKCKLQVSQIPWLVLPFIDESDKHCNLYSLLEKKVCPWELPEARGRAYRGSSSNGWLVTIKEGVEVKLLNLLTRVEIDLPPIPTFSSVKKYQAERHEKQYTLERPGWNPSFRILDRGYMHYYFIRKVILSSSPASNDCIAMAIYGEFYSLAFCRPGDKEWKTIPTWTEHWFRDVIYHEGKFYCLTHIGEILVCTIDPLPRVVDIPAKLPKRSVGSDCYIVGTTGGLLMVERSCKGKGIDLPGSGGVYKCETTRFKIYRMDLSKRRKRWFRVWSLGNNTLFVGYNSSLLISSERFPELKGNCVYFTDDWYEFHTPGFIGGFDFGLFDMEDGSISQLPGYREDRLLVWPPPIWVVPGSQ